MGIVAWVSNLTQKAAYYGQREGEIWIDSKRHVSSRSTWPAFVMTRPATWMKSYFRCLNFWLRRNGADHVAKIYLLFLTAPMLTLPS